MAMAVYSMGLIGILVHDIEYGINDKVVWSWSDESKKHRTKIYYTMGGCPYFLVNGRRVSFSECLRLDI